MERRLVNLRDKLDLLRISHLRPKRAILNTVRNVANDLFGVMDSRFEKEYARTIGGLFANDEHLLQLLRNQTSVVDKTGNILKINEIEQMKKNEQFTNQINEIGKALNSYVASHFFSDAINH